MQVRIVEGNQPQTLGQGMINPKELTPETYRLYCELYLSQKIYEVIKPVSKDTNFRMVSRIIDCISASLYDNLNLETNKVLLLNKLYALFLQNLNLEISKEFLYNLVDHLANYASIMYSNYPR